MYIIYLYVLYRYRYTYHFVIHKFCYFHHWLFSSICWRRCTRIHICVVEVVCGKCLLFLLAFTKLNLQNKNKNDGWKSTHYGVWKQGYYQLVRFFFFFLYTHNTSYLIYYSELVFFLLQWFFFLRVKGSFLKSNIFPINESYRKIPYLKTGKGVSLFGRGLFSFLKCFIFDCGQIIYGSVSYILSLAFQIPVLQTKKKEGF